MLKSGRSQQEEGGRGQELEHGEPLIPAPPPQQQQQGVELEREEPVIPAPPQQQQQQEEQQQGVERGEPTRAVVETRPQKTYLQRLLLEISFST